MPLNYEVSNSRRADCRGSNIQREGDIILGANVHLVLHVILMGESSADLMKNNIRVLRDPGGHVKELHVYTDSRVVSSRCIIESRNKDIDFPQAGAENDEIRGLERLI